MVSPETTRLFFSEPRRGDGGVKCGPSFIVSGFYWIDRDMSVHHPRFSIFHYQSRSVIRIKIPFPFHFNTSISFSHCSRIHDKWPIYIWSYV